MSSLTANQGKSNYVFKFHLNSLLLSLYLCATVQTYATIIITVTTCPIIIRYLAYNLFVSANISSLDSYNLRTQHLS